MDMRMIKFQSRLTKKRASFPKEIIDKFILYFIKFYWSLMLFICSDCGNNVSINLRKLKSKCNLCNQVYCSVCENQKICSRKQGIIMIHLFYLLTLQCIFIHIKSSFLSIFSVDILEYIIILGCLYFIISKNFSHFKEKMGSLMQIKLGRFYLYNFDFKKCLVYMILFIFCLCTFIKISLYCSVNMVFKIILLCVIMVVITL
jgi:hypothetical protein